MTRTVHGIVHGRTIELTEDLEVAEGQEVEITIRSVLPGEVKRSGAGLLRTEGALADDPHWDGIMAEIHRQRKSDTRREIPE